MLWAVLAVASCAQGVDVVDIESAKELEAKVAKAMAVALPATVGLVSLGEQGMSSGSGTIIDKDGWILTAGHVIDEAGQPVKIYFSDGSFVEGKTSGLHWSGREDCGLVRFDPGARELAVAELGESKSLKVGDWAIALGHTYGIETDPYRPPVLRLGRLRLIDDRTVNMDAPLSAGDSGVKSRRSVNESWSASSARIVSGARLSAPSGIVTLPVVEPSAGCNSME